MNAKYNNKEKIIEHYDIASPYYRSIWGEHLHHGYWINGNETKGNSPHLQKYPCFWLYFKHSILNTFETKSLDYSILNS